MLELLAGIALLLSLTLYVLTGGADYGAGMLNLLARGPRAAQQSALIDRAIAPIWEANHVWLILVVTLLFTAFPQAFALISTRLHIPLTLLLIGIVLRGSAFAFRTNDVTRLEDARDTAQRFWKRVFTASSIFTPLMFGVTIGAIASGRLALPVDSFVHLFVSPWLAPFPLLTGMMASLMFAYLAAVYLVVEAESEELKQDFRRQGFALWMALILLTPVILMVARDGAPEVYSGLVHTVPGRIAIIITTAVGLTAGVAIKRRRDRLSRLLAALFIVALVWGWALSQYPYLVEPVLTIRDSAPPTTLRVMIVSLLAGTVLLFPSLWFLYRLFKARAL